MHLLGHSRDLNRGFAAIVVGDRLMLMTDGTVSCMCGARFANYVGGLPQDQLDSILDLLFDKDKGLGLNIVRYNIGGGLNPELSPQLARNNLVRWRAIPGFRWGQ